MVLYATCKHFVQHNGFGQFCKLQRIAKDSHGLILIINTYIYF